MDISLVKTYFNQLKLKNSKCNDFRLLQSYIDIIVLKELYEETLTEKIDGSDKWEFGREGLIEEAIEIDNYERVLITLLRSVYLIASSFITILLYDCNYKNHEGKQISLPRIYSNKDNTFSEKDIVDLFQFAEGAYLLQVFRNECIAHADIPRSFSAISTGKDVNERLKSMKLVSAPLTRVNNSTYNKHIKKLLDSYNLKTTSANRPENILIADELNDLFYKVPLVKDGMRNKRERNLIYNIIKCNPCYSMTFNEVINSVDNLIKGIC